MSLITLAADEDRDLTADEAALLAEMIGTPVTDETGTAGRYMRQAEILERQEALIAEARKAPARTTTPVTEDDKPAGSYADRLKSSLREKYSVPAK